MSATVNLRDIQKWFYSLSFAKKEELKKTYATKRRTQTTYKGTFWTFITPEYEASLTSVPEPRAQDQDAQVAGEQKETTEAQTETKDDSDTSKSPTPKADDTIKSPNKNYSSVILALAIGALVYVALN